VPSNTTTASAVVSYAAIPLARVDIPANTTNILDSYIVDLRTLARPRNWNDGDNQPAPIVDYLQITDTVWRDWPSNSVSVKVPDWAVFARCSITLQGLLVDDDCDFASRIWFGALTGQGANFDYDAPSSLHGVQQQQHFTSTYKFDVRSLRGQTVTMKHQAQRINLANAGHLWTADAPLVQVIFRVDYIEECI
jgi:hypothetical protein